MGEEAEVIETEILEEPITDEASEAEAEESQEVAPEIEIVREGETGSQPDVPVGFKKRINKLTGRVSEARNEAAEANTALELERERTKLLTAALEQAREAKAAELKPPNADDFEDGEYDPKYIADRDAYTRNLIAEEVQKLAPKPVVQPDPEIERRQTLHYERAAEMGAKDYEDAEDAAIDILGTDNVRSLVDASDSSHIVLYYLGKNPDEAERIKQLLDTNPVKATLALGRLEAELKVRPKGKANPAPDPDEELKGGSPSSGEYLQTKLDKLREKAASGGSDAMKDIIALKREAKAKGIIVT